MDQSSVRHMVYLTAGIAKAPGEQIALIAQRIMLGARDQRWGPGPHARD